MDFVLFCELLGERDAQLVEVGECVLDYLRAAGAAEEEGGFGIFGGFGGLFVEGTFAACVTRFAISISIISSLKLYQEIGLTFVATS